MKILDRFEEIIVATLMAAATLITFVAVAHRYLLGIDALYDHLFRIDFSWAQELTIYLFVWMAKFGAAYGVRTGIHVGVDVLVNRLSDKNRARFVHIALFAGAVFTAIVGSMGAFFVYHLSLTDQVSPDLEWPMWIIYLAVPLGSYLMCFRFLQVAWSFHRTGELPHHDHGHVAGVEEDATPEEKAADINWYELDDDLHMKDLKHKHPDDGEEKKP